MEVDAHASEEQAPSASVGGWQCSLSVNMRHLARVLGTFDKIGRDLYIEALPDRLLLRTLNTAQSAFCLCTLPAGMFDEFCVDENPPNVKIWLKVRALPTLRWLASAIRAPACMRAGAHIRTRARTRARACGQLLSPLFRAQNVERTLLQLINHGASSYLRVKLKCLNGVARSRQTRGLAAHLSTERCAVERWAGAHLST